MTENTTTQLLTDFQVLSAEREKQKMRGLNDYSLIGSMLKASDEVRLHTRFIYSLLNPDGKHYQGSLFLRLFLETAGLAGFVDADGARVYKEFSDAGTLKGQIDLLITDGDNWIAIENKINALDGKKQIFRYANYLVQQTEKGEGEEEVDLPPSHESICMVYLSKHAARPASYSLGGYAIDTGGSFLYPGQGNAEHNQDVSPVASYRNLTYSSHIRTWLSRCLDEVGNISNLATAISEYEIIRQKICKEYRSKMMNTESVFLNDAREFDTDKYHAAVALAEELPKLQARWLDDALRTGFQDFLERERKCKELVRLDGKNCPMLKGKFYQAGDADRFFSAQQSVKNKGVFYQVSLDGRHWVLALLFGSKWLHAGVIPVKRSDGIFELDESRKVTEKDLGSGFPPEMRKEESIQKPFPGLISYAKDLRKEAAHELRDFCSSSFAGALNQLIRELARDKGARNEGRDES